MRDRLLTEFDTSDAKIDLQRLLAGGPPKDGIPALTDPKRAPAFAANYPLPGGRVAVVDINGSAVAYPIGILNFHEIANDTVAGVPIAVTYCPLCDSVSVMRRELGDRTLEFGVSGLLYNSNVMMYERGNNGLWSQVMMQAVSGPDAGVRLESLPVAMMTFADYKNRYPDGEVLTTETGHRRDYNSNPYENYFGSDRVFHQFDYDDRLPAKQLGVGVIAGEWKVFISKDAITETPLVLKTLRGQLTISLTDAGILTSDIPDDVYVLQTFYHSWAAFHPESMVITGPEPNAEKSEEDNDGQ